MKCHYEGKGANRVLIPGCMGVSAAGGCGKTDSQVMDYCTCKDDGAEPTSEVDQLRAEVEALKLRIKKLEASK